MRKKATAQDVAEAAGLSKWTVIRAFTPGASIAEESRKKVLAAATALNYRPNLLARSLATRTTHQVAVLVDDFDNPIKLSYLALLTTALQARGLVALLVNINEHSDHIDALLDAEQRQVDAVILFGTSFRPEMLTDRRLQGATRILVVARESQIAAIPSVTCNAQAAVDEICKHLHARGYRRPAFMAGPTTLSTALGRQAAFETFWRREAGIGVACFAASTYSEGAGREAARRFFTEDSSSEGIDVLMCENDVLAYGALNCLRHELRRRIPDDIGLVGFDDGPFSATPAFELTSYEQPIATMLDAALDMALDLRPRENCEFVGRLIVRSSTR